jgi:hypothetical protein
MPSRSRASTPPLQPSLPHISGPAELLDALPYLFGFHPQDSVVLVGLRLGHLLVTARVDRPDAEVGGAILEVAESVVAAGATDLIAVVYAEPDYPHGEAEALASQLADEVEVAGALLLDTLLVRDGRWWSLACPVEGCCPREGTPLEPASPFAADATVRGIVALEDRAALEASLEPVPDGESRRVAPAIAEAERAAVRAVVRGEGARRRRGVKRALFAAARRSGEAPPPAVSLTDVARFGVALGDKEVRDALWLAVDDGRLDGRPLWRELARRLPPPYAAAPLFLFGWGAWRAGDATLAGIAAERALQADPDYTAARLLEAAVISRVNPHTVPRLRRSA